MPTDLLRSWSPDSRVGSVLDLALCETIVKEVETIWYVPEVLVQYRMHGASIASSFSDLDSLLYILDRQLSDTTFRSIWPLLSRRRADAIVRQARVWTGTGRWHEAREFLLRQRPDLPWRYFLPSAAVTLPIVRVLYGIYIRRRNPRLQANYDELRSSS
jgi:hypothetical protein